MSKLLIRFGFAFGSLLLLPLIPFLAILMMEGAQHNPQPVGGFGANMRLVYLLIIGGPIVAIGAAILTITGIFWAITNDQRHTAHQSDFHEPLHTKNDPSRPAN